jgi:hypothetical protein
MNALVAWSVDCTPQAKPLLALSRISSARRRFMLLLLRPLNLVFSIASPPRRPRLARRAHRPGGAAKLRCSLARRPNYRACLCEKLSRTPRVTPEGELDLLRRATSLMGFDSTPFARPKRPDAESRPRTSRESFHRALLACAPGHDDRRTWCIDLSIA